MARVLIADDNAALLAAAGRVLRESGHEVTSTNSGADALCLLAAKPPPDLLVLDMVMPGLDGHEVLRTLGPTAPPVIVITGDMLTPDDFKIGKVKRVLQKPFNATKLKEAVSEVLSPGDPMKDTTEDCPPSVQMTNAERMKAEERIARNRPKDKLDTPTPT